MAVFLIPQCNGKGGLTTFIKPPFPLQARYTFDGCVDRGEGKQTCWQIGKSEFVEEEITKSTLRST